MEALMAARMPPGSLFLCASSNALFASAPSATDPTQRSYAVFFLKNPLVETF
jgi:hypothetical protein